MNRRRVRLGREFGWLWAAHVVSACGTGLAFGAFSIVAIEVLDANSAQVAALSAGGLAGGALLAIPLGPWLETRAKRPVMIGTALLRSAAVATVPAAYLLGVLSFTQLLVVSITTAAAKIAFGAASAAYLRSIVAPDRLVVANSRFESVTWSATAIGPPVGGVLIGIFGPVITLALDAASYLLSALGIAAIRTPEQPPSSETVSTRRSRWSDLVEGWRYILAHPSLRRLFGNALLVNGLIMASEPPLAVLLLGQLGFSAWEYGLAFAIPCVGGLLGPRLAPRVVARYGERSVLRVVGALRACWPLGLAFVQPGMTGLVIVLATEAGLILCCALFNPVLAAHRMRNTAAGHQARVVTAWSISNTISIAVLTLAWGLLAQLTSPRDAIAVAGVLLFGTPFLLPRRCHMSEPAGEARSGEGQVHVDEKART